MGEIILYPVWTIPFSVLKIPGPVLKINFEFFGTYKNSFVKEIILTRPGSGKIIPFPVLKTILKSLEQIKNIW